MEILVTIDFEKKLVDLGCGCINRLQVEIGLINRLKVASFN